MPIFVYNLLIHRAREQKEETVAKFKVCDNVILTHKWTSGDGKSVVLAGAPCMISAIVGRKEYCLQVYGRNLLIEPVKEAHLKKAS
jgi:hypothetical protein